MKIEQANRFPIVKILANMQILPKHETVKEAVYKSFLSNSNKLSVYVDKSLNTWTDVDNRLGGDLIGLIQQYLKYHKENYTQADALRYIKIMSGSSPRIRSVICNHSDNCNSEDLIVEKSEPLEHPALFDLLSEMGIDLHIGKKYLDEVVVYNSTERLETICIGSRNDNDGYTVLLNGLDITVGEQYLRFIRGSKAIQNHLHIFRNIYDFLSVLTYRKIDRLKDDAVICSLGCLEKITPYINGYGYNKIITWFDNDDCGKLATQAIADYASTQPELIVRPANIVYAGFANVHEWHLDNFKRLNLDDQIR